ARRASQRVDPLRRPRARARARASALGPARALPDRARAALGRRPRAVDAVPAAAVPDPPARPAGDHAARRRRPRRRARARARAHAGRARRARRRGAHVRFARRPDGARIAYDVVGRGPRTILLVSPLAGTIELWGAFRDALAAHARVV